MHQKIILSGVLTLALISSGCSTQAKASSQTTVEGQTTTSPQSADGSGSSSGTSDKSSTQASSSETKRSTIGKYGKVKKIIGNSVTIELAELPKRSEKTATDASGTKTTTSEEAPPEGAPPTGEPPTGAGSPPSGGSGSGGNGGPPSGGGTGGSTGGSNGMKSGLGLNTEELKLTGEVVELMIPVGVKITSASTSGMKEIDFADIAQGDTIALYYVEGTENIERVVITPNSTN